MKAVLQFILKSIMMTILVMITHAAYAVDLLTLYQQALTCDPIYQKAIATRLALGEQLPQQVSTLLPSISLVANAAWNRNVTLRAVPPSFLPPGTTGYPTKSYLVTFNQPLYNLTNWFLTSRASAIDKQAAATLIAASQELIARVVRAYLAVLKAQDDLYYTQQERDANAQQLALTKKRYALGIDIVTSIYNAQAAYDASVAQVVIVENTLRNNLVELSLLTGQYYCEVEKLKQPVPLVSPCPDCQMEWIKFASQNNWALIAARYGVIAAQEQIKATVANHSPTLTLVATEGPSYGQSVNTIDTVQSSVGLQLSLPIFQGGLVISQTRQAKDQYVEAYQDMRHQYLIATTTARERFNDVLANIDSIKANRQAVDSANTSVISTKKAFKVRTRSIFDVLIAQKDLYRVQRELAKSQYDYLLNTILLKQTSGNLTVNDVCYLNQLLHNV